jgi:hypothetical protein
MERFDELAAGFLEGLLTQDEQDEFAALVRGDPAFRHRFTALAEVDGLLWGHFVSTAARAELVSRTMLCLPDARRRDQTVQHVMERIAEPPAPAQRTVERISLWRVYLADWRLWAAAAGILLVLAAAVYQIVGRDSIQQNRQQLVALGAISLYDCKGRVSVLTDLIDMKELARPPQALGVKSGLEIDGPGRANVRFWDQTALRLLSTQTMARAWLCGTTSLPLLGKRDTFGKRVTLEAGVLDANVAKQPPDEPMILSTPHAEVQVLGTRFRLTVTPNSTRLDVYEGRVKLTRRNDGKSVVVAAKEFALAGSGVELKATPGAVEPAREEP